MTTMQNAIADYIRATRRPSGEQGNDVVPIELEQRVARLEQIVGDLLNEAPAPDRSFRARLGRHFEKR